MLDTAIHTGTAHPDLAWILVASLLSFLAGLGLGARADGLRERLRPREGTTIDDDPR